MREDEERRSTDNSLEVRRGNHQLRWCSEITVVNGDYHSLSQIDIVSGIEIYQQLRDDNPLHDGTSGPPSASIGDGFGTRVLFSE